MNKNNLLIKLFFKYLDFIKFCLVGLTNTIISLFIYWILLKVNIYYLLSSTLGYIAGILNGYVLSSKFVFKSSNGLKTITKFFVVYLSSLAINLGILYVFVDTFSVNKIVSQIIAIGFNTIYNFTINKIWTFKK